MCTPVAESVYVNIHLSNSLAYAKNADSSWDKIYVWRFDPNLKYLTCFATLKDCDELKQSLCEW